MDIIERIAASYSSLQANCPERNKAFGIVYNNVEIGGVKLSDHPKGKAVTSRVLAKLGYVSTVSVDGDLDDL